MEETSGHLRFTLGGWFLLIAVGLVLVVMLGVMLGVARFVVLEMGQFELAERGIQAVARLRVALVSAEMVSRERKPANVVLGDESVGDPALLSALAESRAWTDQAVAEFQRVLSLEAVNPRYRDARRDDAAFRVALVQARANVDGLAQQPWAQRSPDAIRDVIERIKGRIDELRHLLGLQAFHSAPSHAITAARAALEHEYFWRLGPPARLGAGRRSRSWPMWTHTGRLRASARAPHGRHPGAERRAAARR